MLNIYLADLTGLEDLYDEKVNSLHRERAEKLSAYKMPADRIRGLGAGLLLERGLEDYLSNLRANSESAEPGKNAGHINAVLLPKDEGGRYIVHYGYGPQGKPYLKDYPDVYFSLSHSGNIVVLAVADEEVGIDVQEFRGLNERIAKRFFHQEEINLLETVLEPAKREKLFYKIWTCKEGYIKYTGKGMREELRDFYWNPGEDAIFCEGGKVAGCVDVPIQIAGYQCSVVSGNTIPKIDKIIKILL